MTERISAPRVGDELLEGRTWAPASLGRVAVLGLGVSGKAVVDYLLGPARERWRELKLYGGASNPEARRWAQRVSEAGGAVVFDTDEVLEEFDLAIISPGIPETSRFYQSAKSRAAELIGELEFAWRESRSNARWVAITGTNGKTTTTALTERLLQDGGLNARAVGNIGQAAITVVAADDADVYVAEVSSYQLTSTARFAPDVAVLLNITPDHLGWHGSLEAYAQAKARVFEHLANRAHGLAILNATDEKTRALVRQFKAEGDGRGFDYLPMGTAAGLMGDMRQACGATNAAFETPAGFVIDLKGREHKIDLSGGFGLQGRHNRINGLAAASVAVAMGVDESTIAASLAAFRPLEHRIEPCGTVRGVLFFNDSKATNVDATLVALASFEDVKPILLLGGRDKGTDLAPLVAACEDRAKAVVCFGEAGPRMLEAFSDAAHVAVMSARHLEDAARTALDFAQPGDVVLLSPACASFDEFNSFEHRGSEFKALAAAWAQEV